MAKRTIDTKRGVKNAIGKRLTMIGPKLTTGSHFAELESLDRAASTVGIALPEWAAIYLRMLQAAERRGLIMPPVRNGETHSAIN